MIQSYKLRTKDSWNTILQKTANWINTKRVLPLSITTTLCHTNGEGLITVYYREGIQLTSPIYFKLVRTKKSWINHDTDVLNTIGGNSFLFINNLEVNQGHEECLTVLWHY